MLSLEAHNKILKDQFHWVAIIASLIGMSVSAILSVTLFIGKVNTERSKLNDLKVKYEKLALLYEKQSRRIRNDSIPARRNSTSKTSRQR